MGMFKKIFRRSSKKGELNKGMIYPYFKQASGVLRQTADSPVELELLGGSINDDLDYFYVDYSGEGLELLQKRHLDQLALSMEEFHAMALENYRHFIADHLNTQSDGDAYWFILDGNLESSLLLIGEVWQQIQEALKDELIVCVPTRDVVIATGKGKKESQKSFSERAATVFESGNHPLSDYWFSWEGDRWTRYKSIYELRDQ